MRIAVLLIALLTASAQADLRTLVTSWLEHQSRAATTSNEKPPRA